LLEPYSGGMASLYTVMVDAPSGAITTKLDQFIEKYRGTYPTELMDIVRRLKSLGNTTDVPKIFLSLMKGLIRMTWFVLCMTYRRSICGYTASVFLTRSLYLEMADLRQPEPGRRIRIWKEKCTR
jgi:hypothetical protein